MRDALGSEPTTTVRGQHNVPLSVSATWRNWHARHALFAHRRACPTTMRPDNDATNDNFSKAAQTCMVKRKPLVYDLRVHRSTRRFGRAAFALSHTHAVSIRTQYSTAGKPSSSHLGGVRGRRQNYSRSMPAHASIGARISDQEHRENNRQPNLDRRRLPTRHRLAGVQKTGRGLHNQSLSPVCTHNALQSRAVYQSFVQAHPCSWPKRSERTECDPIRSTHKIGEQTSTTPVGVIELA